MPEEYSEPVRHRANRKTYEFQRGQKKTLERLKRLAPDAGIMQRGDVVWISMEGYGAPAVISHGHVSIRQAFERDRKRISLPIPKSHSTKKSEALRLALLEAIKKSHKGYAVLMAGRADINRFTATLGKYGHVIRMRPDGRAEVQPAQMVLSLADAEALVSFMNLLKPSQQGGGL